MIELPLYMKIYQDYVDDIRNGLLNTGDKLPTEMEIAAKYDVSRITSRRAMERLHAEGYIERTPGRGTYVCDTSEGKNANGGVRSNMADHDKIGLIVPSFSDNFAMELLIGVEQGARDHGYHLMLRRSRNEPGDETLSIESFYESGCKGLILMPQHNDFYNDYLLRLILDQYPVVIIDRQMKGLNTSFIGSDNYTATFNITNQMLELGHRQIGYLSNPVRSATTLQERYTGFREAYFKQRIFWNEDLLLDFSSDGITHWDVKPTRELDETTIINFLYDHPEVTCLFATEYSFSQLAYSAVKKMGLSIPEDISIVGYDGPSSELGNPFLTRILQPQTEMGRQGVSILDQIIKKGEKNVTMILPSKVSNGSSLAAVRTHALDLQVRNEAT